MREFKFNYDEKNDDLFIYLPDSKSLGAVEIGNFIFDFDEKENLVAVQVIDASKVLSKLFSKLLELTKIQELKADVINFRNMAFIRIELIFDSGKESLNIPIPRIKEKSPVLMY